MNTDKAWEILKKEGFKKTDKREQILNIFSETTKYITARDILDIMMVEHPGMSYDTIYRNLSTFVELGILDETELTGEKNFRMHCEVDHHHHHFICMTCGNIKEIHFCPMEMLQNAIPAYQIESHKFEIYGKCPECH